MCYSVIRGGGTITNIEIVYKKLSLIQDEITELRQKNEALEAENHLLSSMLAIYDPDAVDRIKQPLKRGRSIAIDAGEYIRLKADGKTDKQIADEYNCSLSTVSRLRKAILDMRKDIEERRADKNAGEI